MNIYDTAKQKAKELLEKYQVEEPVINVFQIAKDEGLSLNSAKMTGQLKDVAGFFDKETNSIFINSDDPPTRQMFTVAHELGHYKLNHQPDEYGVLYRFQKFDGANDAEKQANCFAANLLVPKKMLKKAMRKYRLDKDNAGILADLFGVSKEMMSYRIKTLECDD